MIITNTNQVQKGIITVSNALYYVVGEKDDSFIKYFFFYPKKGTYGTNIISKYQFKGDTILTEQTTKPIDSPKEFKDYILTNYPEYIL